MDKTNQPDGLRRARLAHGMSQSALARAASISRQALSAIEAGTYQPGVAVALRLSSALGETVERLFAHEGGEIAYVKARWAGGGMPPPAQHVVRPRVALARVGGRLVAVPQPAATLRLAAAAGVLERSAERRHVQVAALRSPAEIDATLLVAGCDPAVTLLAEWLARQRSPVSAVGGRLRGATALTALAAGRAHAAGVHLRDPRSGEYNLAPIRRALKHRHVAVINFARWELGLATPPGNPRGIAGFADLAQAGLRIVNRERGAGARAALDEALVAIGLTAANMAGYEREARGHLEVAAAIANREADAGVTIRVAADAYGLGFVPIREERYDLVMMETEMKSAPVQAMLDALNSRRFAIELRELCAYDTSDTGKLIARLH